jgi:hypothetical protein
MRSRHLLIVLITAAVGVLATSGSALADCSNEIYDTPLPVSSVTPADGATVTQAAARVPFTLVSTLHGVDISMRVSTQDVMGNTGVLSDLYQADFFGISESSTNFGYYSGVSNGGAPTWWTDVPGTYYWQALGVYLDTASYPSACRLVASPVYTLHVVTPPAPPPAPTPQPTTTPAARPPVMTGSVAKSLAVKLIASKTHQHPRVSGSCQEFNNTTASCHVAWTAGGSSYKAAGTIWDYLKGGTSYWWYNVHGTRTTLACLARRQRSRSCTHPFHWT